MTFEFQSQLISWRGPAPFIFAPVPPAESVQIKSVSRIVSYGWGVIPVLAEFGKTAYSTSLLPNDRLYKDHLYMVPIKMVVQKAENLKVGDLVNIQLIIERLASSSDQE